MNPDVETILRKLGDTAALIMERSFMERVAEITAAADREIETAGVAYHRKLADIRTHAIMEIKGAVGDWKRAIPPEVLAELTQQDDEDYDPEPPF